MLNSDLAEVSSAMNSSGQSPRCNHQMPSGKICQRPAGHSGAGGHQALVWRENPICYAIFYPPPKILKIGVGVNPSLVLCSAKRTLSVRRKFSWWPSGSIIWSQPVSHPIRFTNEGRLQAEVSYTLNPWLEIESTEWFETGDRTEEDLILIMDQAQAYIDKRLQDAA